MKNPCIEMLLQLEIPPKELELVHAADVKKVVSKESFSETRQLPARPSVRPAVSLRTNQERLFWVGQRRRRRRPETLL